MELLLLAAAGCTAIDVFSLLKKMRQGLEGLEIDVTGERREDHPRIYHKVELVYRVRGALNMEKVRKAVELSLQKYCSASITLRRAGAELKYSVEMEPSPEGLGCYVVDPDL